jgi:hypothetical protein
MQLITTSAIKKSIAAFYVFVNTLISCAILFKSGYPAGNYNERSLIDHFFNYHRAFFRHPASRHFPKRFVIFQEILFARSVKFIQKLCVNGRIASITARHPMPFFSAVAICFRTIITASARDVMSFISFEKSG